MNQRIPITNFLKGELSEKWSCRFDSQVYGQGMSKLENFIPFAQGGITLRPGSELIGAVKTAANKTYLYPMIINSSLSYVLEFGNNYIRYWKNGLPITSGGNPVETVTTYTTAMLAELQFCQFDKTLIITHRSIPIKALIYTTGDTFTFGDFSLDGAAWAASHAYAADIIVYSGDNYYYSLIAGTSGTTAPTGTGQAIVDGTVTWRFLQTAPFRSSTNYPGCCSYFNGRLWFASSFREPQKIWASRPFEYGNFQLFDVSVFSNRQLKDPAIFYFKGTASGKTISGLLVDPRELASVGQYITGPVINDVPQVPATAIIESMTVNSITVASAENLVAGTQYYAASWWPDTTIPVYENITTRTDVIGDGSAIEIELNSDQNNYINFMASSKVLIIGTVSDEWTLPNNITAINIMAQLQTRIGSAAKQGLLYDSAVIFVQGDLKKVREYFYQTDNESYKSPDLTYFADHILGSGIVDFDYVQNPESQMVFVTSDGYIALLSYSKQYDLLAWSRHIIGDAVESVAIVPGATGDDIYMTVKRGSSRFIEKLSQMFSGYHVDSGVILTKTVAKTIGPYTVAWTASTITGLTWLASTACYIVSDNVAYSVTVGADGSVTVPAGVTGTTLYLGIPFIGSARTMRITSNSEIGLSQGFGKRFIKSVLRLYRSFSFTTGTKSPEAITVTGPFTGDKEVQNSEGWESDGWLSFTQNQPLPVTILGVMAEIDG
jgi:hypothetical protein